MVYILGDEFGVSAVFGLGESIALEWHSDIGGRLTGYRASYIAWLLL